MTVSRSGLYLCEKTHQGYDSWQHVCPECSKRFISKQKLTMHIKYVSWHNNYPEQLYFLLLLFCFVTMAGLDCLPFGWHRKVSTLQARGCFLNPYPL